MQYYNTKTICSQLLLPCKCITSSHVRFASKPAVSHNRAKSQKSNFGLDKEERKALRRKLLKDREQTTDMHIFRKIYPWHNKWELASHLKDSEVYNSDGLIALSKPYGISQTSNHAAKENKTIIETLVSGGVPEHVPSIENTLPVLKDLYNVDHLEVIKSTERWSSGIVLLSTNPSLTERVWKSFRSSQAMQEPHLTYWAVTCGKPNPITAASRVAVGLECIPNSGNVPVIKNSHKKSQVKKGDIKLAVVEHLTQVFNKETDMSLVEVSVLLTKMHFLRVWLAHSYSPVLGDHLYSGRVKSVLEKKVLISPQNLTTYTAQILPDDTLSRLNLPQKAVEMIPCHLHLAKLRLVRFLKGSSDLIITAPPPPHFIWTCQQLGLMSQEEKGEQLE